MTYDVVIVGGGISGLTSAAFLSKKGYKVLLCEKERSIGGLVSSFDYKGFRFDAGIRAFENSGVLFPMLNDLGLEIEFCENNVSLGIEDNIIKIKSKDSVKEYQTMLGKLYPENIEEIEDIIKEIEKIMDYMDMLYGIENPVFKDIPNDKEYLFKTLFPWLLRYLKNGWKISKLNDPVDEYLQKFTSHRELIDIIGQHFFNKTPTFFALSYFSMYLDYRYPKGGIGSLSEKLKEFIKNNNGEILLETNICKVNIEDKAIEDTRGNKYSYMNLIWASNLKKLYEYIEVEKVKDNKIKSKILNMREVVKNKIGGDSVLTLYATVDIDKHYFEEKCTEHFFYTAKKCGINKLDIYNRFKECMGSKKISKVEKIKLIEDYCKLTTYEISIPVMRDYSLAPKGKTGLIISMLLDYTFVKDIKDEGWYEEFKDIVCNNIVEVLNNSCFRDFKNYIIDKFISTPLTIEKRTASENGAITGWAFTNSYIPVERNMIKVKKAVETEIPSIFQAGQWSFSPSGFPIAIITGKVAADKCKRV